MPGGAGELRWFVMLTDTQSNSYDLEVAGPEPGVQRGRPFVTDFDPAGVNPLEIPTPKSRTFIPSRVSDNLYLMGTGYMATLQALPEPLRSQMLYGDFNAGIEDDPWQVIPTAWVEAAMKRWRSRSPKGPDGFDRRRCRARGQGQHHHGTLVLAE